MQHRLKQREDEFLKMVEETQAKVFEEIRNKADAIGTETSRRLLVISWSV